MIEYVLVTSTEGVAIVVTSVESSIKLPSVSSPLSLMSVISFVLSGLLAVAVTVFKILPLSEPIL